jgi:signal transduction histidine kinase
MSEDELKKACILIVDDEVANSCLLQSLFNRTGFANNTTVNDSRKALGQIAELNPDLLLLDLNMPHVSGFDVLQELRAVNPAENYLPVLVLTADVNPKTKRRALAAGATDFLQKPFDTTEVLMRVRNLIKTRLLQLALQNHNALLEQKVSERTAELTDALSELKKTQNQIVQQERLRAFGEMAGGIVHDFNNSLMSIIGYSDLLLHDPKAFDDRETALDYLKTLNIAGRDAAQVIGRLRDFYRERETEDVFVSLDLNQLIKESVSLTQPKWKTQALETGRTIDVELDLEKLPHVSGNASELREATTNLIFNAVDAMPRGGTITLRSRRDGNDVIFEIADTGAGMSEEIRNRCLEPFFSTKGEKGTGLGLSMVFGIIKRHNGTFEIQSVPDRGTTMQIRLPSETTASNCASEEIGTLDRSVRVLVVDDDAVPRDVVTRYLTSDGHKVTTASSGAEAMVRLMEEHFDLLLTDHAMAGMNGVQLASALRKMGGDQPVILMTASTDANFQPEKSADVSIVLRKPIPQKSLRQALYEVLEVAAQ